MSVISRWLGRVVEKSLRKSTALAPLAEISRQQLIIDLLRRPRYADPQRLAHFEQQVFSQGGEDGILREIFRRIGETDRTFVEIGVGDGLENNTAFLLVQGWSGMWIEGDHAHCEAIRTTCAREIAEARLKLVESIVTAENASRLVQARRPAPEFDLLSLDVDRNTYHVWAALAALKPRVVVVEYNATFPADCAWIAEYDATKWWNKTSYFGASLKAFETLGAKLGYALVACDIAGVNAFFVRSDLVADRFTAPFTAENHYEPARFYLHIRSGHPRALHD